MADVEFTKEAFDTLTEAQLTAIRRLIANNSCVRVLRDFSMPEGWMYFIQKHTPDGREIHGGISPEGEVHT